MFSISVVEMAAVISSCVGLVVLIAFLVAITTVVRRHRPDAAPILLWAMIFEASISVLVPVIQTLLPRFISMGGLSSGGGSFAEAYALSNLIFGLAHAAARLFLLWGIVRLAQPANR